MPLQRAALATVAAVAVSLTACAPAGLTTVAGDAAPGPGSSPVASSTASSSMPATAQTTPPTSAPPTTALPTSASPPSPAGPTQPTAAPSTPTADAPSAEVTDPPADLTLLGPGTNHNWVADTAGYVYPASTVNAWLTGRKRRPDKKIVFLTFDDGPNPQTSHVILDALKKAGVHATFFVVGSQIGSAPDVLSRQIAEGHSVSPHSWSHDYSLLYPGRRGSTETITQECDRTVARIREVLGDDYAPQSWRYPGGHMSWTGLEGADRALAQRSITWLDWNSDTRDSAPTSERPKTVKQTVKNATIQVREGYHVIVVLGHDTHEKKLTSESVGAMIRAFKHAGYSFGTIS